MDDIALGERHFYTGWNLLSTMQGQNGRVCKPSHRFERLRIGWGRQVQLQKQKNSETLEVDLTGNSHLCIFQLDRIMRRSQSSNASLCAFLHGLSISKV